MAIRIWSPLFKVAAEGDAKMAAKWQDMLIRTLPSGWQHKVM